jgi:hypothetical protein
MKVQEALKLARLGLQDAREIARDAWGGPSIQFCEARDMVAKWEKTVKELEENYGN